MLLLKFSRNGQQKEGIAQNQEETKKTSSGFLKEVPAKHQRARMGVTVWGKQKTVKFMKCNLFIWFI